MHFLMLAGYFRHCFYMLYNLDLFSDSTCNVSRKVTVDQGKTYLVYYSMYHGYQLARTEPQGVLFVVKDSIMRL